MNEDSALIFLSSLTLSGIKILSQKEYTSVKSLQEIYNHYLIDMYVGGVFLPIILKIEQRLKSCLINVIENFDDFNNPNNYMKKDLTRLKNNINETYVHGNNPEEIIPTMTFTNVIYWYSIFQKKLRKKFKSSFHGTTSNIQRII